MLWNLALGTHNLHDEKGVPTFFADVVIFTEAIAPTIKDKAAQKAAHAKARLAGYSIAVCAQQRDLVVAYRRRLFKITSRSYSQYVDGVPGVSPNRGTFIVFLETRDTRTPLAVVAEHRINAAFTPWIRGERAFRIRMWRKHTDGTLDSIRRLKGSRYQVAAGGDLNTPHGVSGYEGRLHEAGEHFDRLGTTGTFTLVDVLSRKGSDHNRLRAVVTLKEKA